MAFTRDRTPLLHVALDEGEGAPVVMLHGIASSSVTFQNVVPLVSPHHRCIAIDLLGFGESPIPPDAEYTIAEHTAAIERTLKTIHLHEPFTLVGHSMGALIAARLALRFPKQVSKLVLVSPPIYVKPEELSNLLDRGVMDFYLRAYKYLRANEAFTLRSAEFVEHLLPIPKAMDINERTWTPFVKSLEHSIESQTTISDLASVTAPIEMVYGSMDQFRSDGVLRIVERMSGVTTHRVLGSDHLIGKRLARVVATAIG
ncbi:alpha/beta fold hydrolase [Lacisediminihabitans changchengi]|uniref:Alpha/beta hydrolase n=1 Tax=Lacisediminihabitans changchengi TaxID=2787634 RepID=A0A934W159_9MICO|nr:alpha/beta hydrolase [Lacisediminihabitans changchengi]MBK4346533.1 alpha/beta hydrolase [Lacisediminihabitans changchengi]